MARHTRVLAAVAALSLVVAACGGDDSSSDTTVASGGELELVKEGSLTVCSDAPYEPFEFQDENGEWTGFDMDVVRAIAEDNGLELEVSVQPFDGIWLAPAAGKCDMVASSMTITEERENAADFTQSYFDAFQSLLVRKADAEKYNSLEALAVLQDYLINKERADKQGTSTVSVKFEDTPEQYGFAVKTGDTALLDILNKGIDALKESGDYKTIYDKYFIG